MKKAVVIYSGGMDSFTVLHKARLENDWLAAISFNYGQRHAKELDVARKVCMKVGIQHHVVDLASIKPLLAGSALTDDIPVPEGHYEEASMQQTVVPNRNMIMLSIAIGYAVSVNAESVYFGAHSGDHAIYPDCRTEFVDAMNAVSQLANYQSVSVVAPYLHKNKIDILSDGLSMGLDYTDTWTCYNGRARACGKCGACQERLEAFAKNNVTDPLVYE